MCVDICIQFTLMFWLPNTDQEYVLYILSGLWGLTDGIWQTQINGIFYSQYLNKVILFVTRNLQGSRNWHFSIRRMLCLLYLYDIKKSQPKVSRAEIYSKPKVFVRMQLTNHELYTSQIKFMSTCQYY